MGDYTTNLPPGFHFFPSDEELVLHFLHRKAARLPCQPNIIPTLDLHQLDPWQLNGKALQGGNKLWYFFARNTQHRATPNGYWDPVGTDEAIRNGDRDVGIKKALVFYCGEIKTNWIMHEYHLSNAIPSASTNGRPSSRRRANPRPETNRWVVCRVHESPCNSRQGSFRDNGRELSCLDEVFLSLDDLEEVISLPD